MATEEFHLKGTLEISNPASLSKQGQLGHVAQVIVQSSSEYLQE